MREIAGLIALPLDIVDIVWKGWIVKTLWFWFLSHVATTPSWLVCCFGVVIMYLLFGTILLDKEDDQEMLVKSCERKGQSIFNGLLALGIAWVAKTYLC